MFNPLHVRGKTMYKYYMVYSITQTSPYMASMLMRKVFAVAVLPGYGQSCFLSTIHAVRGLHLNDALTGILGRSNRSFNNASG